LQLEKESPSYITTAPEGGADVLCSVGYSHQTQKAAKLHTKTAINARFVTHKMDYRCTAYVLY